MNSLKILTTIFCLSGIVLLIITYFSYNNTKNYLETAKTTQGTVIELQESLSDMDEDGYKSKLYTPIVEYTDENGDKQTIMGSVASYPARYQINDNVELLYQENGESKVRIKSFSELWLFAAIVGGIGAIDLLVGLIILGILIGIKRNQDVV